MNYALSKTMHEAMRLLQTGDLHAATAAIQRGLMGAEDRSAFHPGYAGGAPEKPWIDAECRVVDVSDPEQATEHPDLEPPREIRETIGEQLSNSIHSLAPRGRVSTTYSFRKVIWVGSCRCLSCCTAARSHPTILRGGPA